MRLFRLDGSHTKFTNPFRVESRVPHHRGPKLLGGFAGSLGNKLGGHSIPFESHCARVSECPDFSNQEKQGASIPSIDTSDGVDRRVGHDLEALE